MKQIKDDTDEEICHVLGLEESILWKWLHYPKKSIDSIQSLSKYQMVFFFHKTTTNNFTVCTETQTTLNSQSNLEKEE